MVGLKQTERTKRHRAGLQETARRVLVLEARITELEAQLAAQAARPAAFLPVRGRKSARVGELEEIIEELDTTVGRLKAQKATIVELEAVAVAPVVADLTKRAARAEEAERELASIHYWLEQRLGPEYERLIASDRALIMCGIAGGGADPLTDSEVGRIADALKVDPVAMAALFKIMGLLTPEQVGALRLKFFGARPKSPRVRRDASEVGKELRRAVPKTVLRAKLRMP